MLKWNAAKVRNLTSMEVWIFIIARVLIGFAAGVLVARHFPQVADALAGCWLTGTTAQSDFSSACLSALRLVAFADRP
jgi:hypothetical protein